MGLPEAIKIAELVATIVAALVIVFGGYAMWRLSRVFATKLALEEMGKRIDGVERDVDTVRATAGDARHHVELLEERLKAVPDGDDIAELRNTLYDVTQGLTAANTRLVGVDAQFDRLERWIEATSKGVEWIKNHMIEAGK